MDENKVSVKKQLFLEAGMWLLVTVPIVLRGFLLNSKIIDYAYIVCGLGFAILTIIIFIVMALRAVLFAYYDKKGELN